MPYQLPNLDDLTRPCQSLLQQYSTVPIQQLTALRLLNIIAQNFNKQLDDTNNNVTGNLAPILAGIYTYCMESIAQTFYLNAPEYKLGYLYNSGSPLYSSLSKILNITKSNPLTHRDKLIYLNKCLQFIEANASILSQHLHQENLPLQTVKQEIKNLLINELSLLTAPITKIINAVPTESALSEKMQKFPEKYIEAKKKANNFFFGAYINPERLFIAQLAAAIATLHHTDDDAQSKNYFTRSQRIKMGILLYGRYNIKNTYWVRSADSNSVWCKIENEMLNTTTYENLSDAQKVACLASCRSYLESNETRQLLENYGLAHFKEDNQLINIDQKLTPIIEFIKALEIKLGATFLKNWPATRAGSLIGAIVGAMPACAVGVAIGSKFRPHASAVAPVHEPIGVASQLATVVIGAAAPNAVARFLASDFIISTTLSMAFAQVFELIGIAAGTVAGGAIGFTIDLTYKGLRELCIRYLNFFDQQPLSINQADKELIQCLLSLPAELFAAEKQNHIVSQLGTTPLQPVLAFQQ